LRRMREMLECAGSRTLALIDEIGSGTEPGAGAALAAAMLERLLERGARGVVTTHATELKLFAHQTPGAVNASVRFDPQTFAPTYELDVGIPGQSLAWALARALGIEEAVIRKAERRMERREQDYETALAELARRTAEVAAEREGLEAQRTASAREAQALESSREELDRQRRNFAAQAEVKLQQALRDFVSELHERAVAGTTRRTKPSAAQAALLARTIDAIHRELGVGSAGAPGDGDAAFAPADRVMVASLNQEGVVAEDYGETVLVSIGAMKAVVKKGDIIRRSPHGEAAARPGRAGGEGEAQLSAASAAAVELDVRGMRYVQAEPLVERWIDGALLGGNSTLRLIHGKGTGLLGRGLQEYLRSHPGVRSVRYGNEDEGSSGVTIIELR
jgi:DNA mismatch repair protein MutS2